MKARLQQVIKRCGVSLLWVGATCLAGFAADNPNIVAHDAWARVPAPSKTETALYMVIENHSTQPRAVVSATAKEASKVEMHEMKMMKQDKAGEKQGGMPGMTKSTEKGKEMDNSMMVMSPVARIAIPANGQTTLAPNGLHMMLFGLKSKLAEGDKVSVTLKLDDGSTVPVTATVRQ
jgi:copper(I)-binding protein